MDKPLRVLPAPPRALRLYSSPPFWLYVVLVGIPSLLLTVVVGCLLYVSYRSVRRGQMASGAVLLLAALVPFVWFAIRTVQAERADREHAGCLAGLAKSGPIASYPDVLVMRTPLLPDATAARLMLAAGFREVDAIGGDPPGGGPPRTETFTLNSGDGCRARLQAWEAKGADFLDFLGSGLRRCLTSTKWDSGGAPKRTAAVFLLHGKFTTVTPGCKGGSPRELRVTDGRGDVLVDYVNEPYAERPSFPLLVSFKGFETTPPKRLNLLDDQFVLRNLKK